MTLQKQVISIPLRLGIDTKESPVLVANDRFAAIQNAVFDRGALGELHKRNGYSLIPSVDISGNPITGEQALAVFNEELDMIASNELYSFGQQAQAWVPRGTIVPIGVTENAIQKSAVSISNPDSATLSGITLYAWVEPGGVFAKVIDEASGTVYAGRQQLSGTLANPKVISTGAALLVLCTTSTGGLVAFGVSPAVPATISGPTTVIASSTLANNAIFDAAVINGVVIVGTMTAGGDLILYSLTLPGLTVAHTQNVVAVTATGITVIGIQNDVFLSVVGTAVTQFIHSWFYTTALINVSGPYTVASGLPTIPRMTAVAAGTLTATVVYEQTTIGGGNVISLSSVVSGSGATSLGSVLGNVSIASQPLPGGYLLTQFPSTTQQTFFLQQIAPSGGGAVATVVGKYFALNAGPAPTNNRLPQFQLLSSGVYGLAVSDQIALESVNGTAAVIDGLAELVLNFSTAKVRKAQLGQTLHLASGSLLWGYDGSSLVEHGFNVYPEEPTLTFLTSQLAIVVDTQDPTGVKPQSVSIYVPDNAKNPGGPGVGALITPGEYFCFNAFTEPISGSSTDADPYLFYFTRDGVGIAPSGAAFAAFTIVQIPILSTMTAVEVASAIYNQLIILSTDGNYTITPPAPISQTNGLVGQRIVCTATDATNAVSQPALNRVFSVTQAFQGTASTYQPVFTITCCPAVLVKGGQYFTFGIMAPLSTALTFFQGYMWFKVAGVGTDPNPFDGSSYSLPGVEVDLVGNETADAVAALVAAAFHAAYPQSATYGVNVFGPAGAGTGNVVAIQTVVDSFPTPATDWAQNPATGGVAQGYIGENVNAINEMLTVNYAAVYQWVDGQGQLHQSAPSVPVTAYIPAWVTQGTGAAVPPNAVIEISVQNLTLTLKQGVDIVIYRTPSDPPANPIDQVYYSVTNPPTILPNVPGDVDPTTFVDYSSDTAILSNQALYTGGGVYENDGPPACAFLVNHQDRLWLATLEDPDLLWYSKEFQNGLGVAFSVNQTIRLNPSVGTVVGGPITAAASMDGALVAFQLNQPWLIAGTGPDATGNNGSFSDPAPIASSVGCRDPDSVLLLPEGLIFKSTQGIYLLSRQYAVNYIGVDVAAYNADVVSNARLVNDGTRALFLSQSGTPLIFDYFYGSWGTLGNHQGVDAVIDASGSYTYLNATGVIYRENPGVYSDNGAGFEMLVQTADIKFAGVNGFQRIWKAFVQGHFKGGQQYQVQITYDEETSATDVFNFTPASDCTAFRVDPSRQLCKAIQFTIVDVAPFATATTWGLDAIDLEVGIRKGGNKGIGATRSIG